MGQFSDISPQMSVIPPSQEIQVYFATWRQGVKSELPSVVTNVHYEPRSLIINLANKGPQVAIGNRMNSERIAAKRLGNRN